MTWAERKQIDPSYVLTLLNAAALIGAGEAEGRPFGLVQPSASVAGNAGEGRRCAWSALPEHSGVGRENDPGSTAPRSLPHEQEPETVIEAWMNDGFPGAVPEIPVADVDRAAAYYRDHLGFTIQWADEDGGGIGGIWKGRCRLFLTNGAFRKRYGNLGPVVIWLNLNSKNEVEELHEDWRRLGARIVSPPESKPWQLHEFTAADLDGNLIRVFYDFHGDT